MTKKMSWCLALALLSTAGVRAAAATPKPSWDCLRFLVGSWTGDSTGPDQGAGYFRFEPRQNGRVLLRTNHAEYPAQGSQPASLHDDLMVVEPAAKGLKATFVDSEGNVILYDSIECTDKPAAVVFLSSAVTARPRFRLSYKQLEGGRLEGLFEIAQPDAPFSPYKRWVAKPKAL